MDISIKKWPNSDHLKRTYFHLCITIENTSILLHLMKLLDQSICKYPNIKTDANIKRV